MNSMDVCLRLLRAQSEAQVDKVFASTAEMRQPENWRLLDDRDTNFNVVTNQAMSGGKAATELMTNMVDAMLLKQARIMGIDPLGKQAPESMYDAVETLIGFHGGKIINEDDSVLLDYARKNLIIGVTGTDEGVNPCYTFVDNGEGQTPEAFPNTFLSLSKGTKKEIKFVQGKYNMGSSGVLSFCGEKWYKLIISRRFDGASAWGWTLVRLRPGGGTPTAEYFAPSGAVPTFQTDMLYPLSLKSGKLYEGCAITTGTIVKLYDFQIGKGFRSFRGAREAFNENLVETILPFRLLDLRYNPDPARGGDRALGVDARRFYGMEYILLRSHRTEGDEVEEAAALGEKILVDDIHHNKFGHIQITAIPLKKGQPAWLQPQNSRNRVFHAVNGQVQFKESRGFLAQCRLPALMDRVVIIVDATELKYEAHNRIWKGDREHILDTNFGEGYKDIVQKAITSSPTLRDLHEQVARQELASAAREQSNDLFQKLVDDDPQVAALLTGDHPTIIVPKAIVTKKPYVGKYSPTQFLLDTSVRGRALRLPVNRLLTVGATTDAENDYLHRVDNRGSLYLSDESLHTKLNVHKHLKDGRVVLRFEPVAGELAIGETLSFDVGLFDPCLAAPVVDHISIEVVDPVAPPEPVKQRRKKKRKLEKKPTHGLPPFKLLTNDGRAIGDHETEQWPETFSAADGGLVSDLGEKGSLYKINYDNTYHLSYMSKARTEIEREAITEKYITGMRLLMLGLERAFDALPQGAEAPDWVHSAGDDIRRLAARGAASTVLALADHLPRIAAMSAEDA
jgi:hypothetical protein